MVIGDRLMSGNRERVEAASVVSSMTIEQVGYRTKKRNGDDEVRVRCDFWRRLDSFRTSRPQTRGPREQVAMEARSSRDATHQTD